MGCWKVMSVLFVNVQCFSMQNLSQCVLLSLILSATFYDIVLYNVLI